MTSLPVAVRTAEMLMHLEHPMLPQAALDYVREETGLGASGAYEQVRMSLADWLEVSVPSLPSKSGWYEWWERNEIEAIRYHANAHLRQTTDTGPLMILTRRWLQKVLRAAEICLEIESIVIPEPVQQGEGK